MTETPEKKGKLKITLEVEVNEEMMDLAKDALSKWPTMRRGGGEKKE